MKTPPIVRALRALPFPRRSSLRRLWWPLVLAALGTAPFAAAQSITGNAATATALQTGRLINGVLFDGTAGITVPAAGSTLTDTVPVSKGGTGNTNYNLRDGLNGSSINWGGRKMFNSGSVEVLDWQGSRLFDSSGVTTVNWETKTLSDGWALGAPASITLPSSIALAGDPTIAGNLTVNGTTSGTSTTAAAIVGKSMGLTENLFVGGTTNSAGVITSTARVGGSGYGIKDTEGTVMVGTYIDHSQLQGGIGTQSAHDFFLFTGNSSPQVIVKNSTGNVGIGTTTPTAKLAVDAGAGTNSSTPTVTLSGKYEGSLYANGGLRANAFQQTNGPYGGGVSLQRSWFDGTTYSYQDILNVTAAGNVGIGTTNPTSKLVIDSGAGANSSMPTIALEGKYEGSQYATGGIRANAFQQTSGPYGGGVSLQRFWFDGTAYSYQDILNVTAAGNVGIGTTSPAMALDVRSGSAQVANLQLNDAATATAPSLLRLYHASSVQPGIPGVGTLGFGSQIEFAAPLNSGSGTNDQAVIGAAYNSTNGNSSALYFQTANNGTLGTRMLIDPIGNVGIGTMGPKSIAGVSTVLDVSGITASIVLHATSQSKTWEMFNDGPGLLRFYSSGHADTMALDQNGNVGIGTTTPTAKLDVAGNANISGGLTLGSLTLAGTAFNPSDYVKSNGTSAVSATALTSTGGSVTGGTNTGLKLSPGAGNTNLVLDHDNGSGVEGTGRVEVRDTLAITNAVTAPQYLLIGNQFSGTGPGTPNNNPAILRGLDGAFQFGKGDNWTGNNQGGTFTYAVGINPTASGTLDVFRANSDGGTILNVNGGANATGYRIAAQNNGAYVFRVGPTGYTVLDVTSSSDALTVNQNGSGNAAIFSGGNVGVGTTAPLGKLHIKGGYPQLVLDDSAAGVGDQIGLLDGGILRQTIGHINTTHSLQFGTGGTDASGTGLTTRLSIDENGNVGIGTTSPAYTLEVIGKASLSGTSNPEFYMLASATGTAPRPLIRQSIAGTEYALLGLAGSANDLVAGSVLGDFVLSGRSTKNIIFTPDGSTASLYLKNGGNVGIGTAAPAAKLDVAGSANVSGNLTVAGQSTTNSLSVTANATVGGQVSAASAAIANAVTAGSVSATGAVSGGSLNSSSGAVNGGSTTGLTLSAGGTNQNITLAPDGNGSVKIANTVATKTPRLSLVNDQAEFANIDYPGSGAAYSLFGGALNAAGWLVFDQRQAGKGIALNAAGAGNVVLGTNSAERLRVDSAGNVGIGTTTPAQLLHVAGVNYGQMRISGAANLGAIIEFADTGGTVNSRIVGFGSTGGADASSLRFDSGGVEHMRLAASGNVGIGTAAPAAKLEVAGDTLVDNNATITGNETVAGSLSVGQGSAVTKIAGGDVTTPGLVSSSSLRVSGGSTLYGPVVINNDTTVSGTIHLGAVALSSTGANFGGMPLQNLGAPVGNNDAANLIYVQNQNPLVWSNTNPTSAYFKAGVQQVGLGVTSPLAPLHLKASNSDGEVARFMPAGNDLTKRSYLRLNNQSAESWWEFSVQDATGGSNDNGLALRARNGSGASVERMYLASDGSVGIGTTQTQGYKLAVNGTVHTKEVVVDSLNWPDYVFDKNYRNAPLSEVEQHIKEEGHLPGVPSAQEVTEKGVGVGQMQALLLSKVEELTLHLIAQEKRIERLEAENAALKAAR